MYFFLYVFRFDVLVLRGGFIYEMEKYYRDVNIKLKNNNVNIFESVFYINKVFKN